MTARVPSPIRRNLSTDEWEQLAAWGDSVPLKEQAHRLGRSYQVIIYARGVLARDGRLAIRRTPDYRHWTVEEDQLLEALLDRGMSYEQIARRMKRSVSSVGTRACKIGLSKMGGGTYTAAGVARLLGVPCSKTVLGWISRGWLAAKNISDGKEAYWRIELESIWAFLENIGTWMAWDPERITDGDLKAWAIELRANGPRWIPAGEAFRRLHITQAALCGYARRGLLTAVLYSRWWYLESELVTFTIPSEREPATIICLECGKALRGNKAVGVHQGRVHRRREAA